VALHWLTFYGSVKLANASVAATCMALAPVVTALIEPAVTGARFERHNLLLGILVIPGVALVVGGIPGSMHLGFWVGVVSAALAALYTALNKRFLGHHDAMAVTWVALSPSNFPAALISLAPLAFAAAIAPSFIFTKNGLVSVLVMRPTTTS
jgi:drug/metabolite transporter (DMT)-like permease